jgi:hypothetical protein
MEQTAGHLQASTYCERAVNQQSTNPKVGGISVFELY